MRARLLAVVVLLTVPLAGCADDTPADGGTSGPVEVTAVDNAFDPEELSVEQGRTVEWTNEGENPHTVEIAPEGGGDTLHSEEIDPGQSTSYTFEDTGSYDVWCRFHGQAGQGMAMTVFVGEKTTAQ